MVTWAVWKTSIKTYFGLSLARYYLARRDIKFLGFPGVVLALAVGLAPLVYIYQRLLNAAYDATLPLGQSQVVLTMSLVTASVMVLFFGFAYVLSVFYLSTDLSLLVPLPLKPWQVLSGKFLVVLLSEYLTMAPFLLPGFIVFGLRSGAGTLYWVQALAIYILAPIIPVSIAAVVIMALMSVANLTRYKDTVRFAGMVLFILFILAFNIMITRIEPGREAEFIAQLFLSEEGLVVQYGKVFPPAVWATRALAAQTMAARWSWFLLFTGVAVASAGVTGITGQGLFYQGLIGSEEVRAGKRLTKSQLVVRSRKASGPARAIMLRDFRMLVRTPIYVLNSVAMIFLLPVFLALPLLLGGTTQSLFLGSLLDPTFSRLAGAGYLVVMALFAPASSTAFSREGRLFWVSRVVPVDPSTQVQGKLAQGYLVLLLAVPVLALFGFGLAGWGPVDFLLVTLTGLAASLPLISLSLLVDLLRPYLTWENPQQAIKQNLNVIFAMVLGGALVAGQAFMVTRMMGAGTGSTLALLATAGASLLLGAGIHGALLRLSSVLYQRVEI